jgi:hypothetical protein
MLVRSSHNLVNKVTCESVWGANGEPGDGVFRALTMSATPAITISVELAKGMGILVGNQERVSAILIARVSQIQHW